MPPNEFHYVQTNTLEDLVAKGWPIAPPGPQEAGPSNWVDRAHEQALNDLHGYLDIGLHPQNQNHSNSSNDPEELRNISHIINSRFRISPPPFADLFNPLLQDHRRFNGAINNDENLEDCYSLTSPLDILQLTDEMDSSSAINIQTP